MRERTSDAKDAPDHYFALNDWVKLKHHAKTKFEFKWKGPYYVVRLGNPGVYYLMEPSGRMLDAPVNQRDLAPWNTPLEDSEEFFYDGSQRVQTDPASFIPLVNPAPYKGNINAKFTLSEE